MTVMVRMELREGGHKHSSCSIFFSTFLIIIGGGNAYATFLSNLQLEHRIPVLVNLEKVNKRLLVSKFLLSQADLCSEWRRENLKYLLNYVLTEAPFCHPRNLSFPGQPICYYVPFPRLVSCLKLHITKVTPM